MNDSVLFLALATCTAFAATNLDSAALLVAFAGTARPVKVFVAFSAVGAGVVLASLLISLLASSVQIPARVFGLVPLSIGLWQLANLERTRTAGTPAPVATSLRVMIACFVSCSADNLSVFVAMLVKYGREAAPWACGLLGLLYIVAGLAGAFAGYRIIGPNVRLRGIAPAATACVGLAMLLG